MDRLEFNFFLYKRDILRILLNLYCENDSTRYIAANPVFYKQTKHIEINYHIVREKLKGLIHLLPISTTEH